MAGKKKSKRPFQEKVSQWREEAREKNVKEHPMTIIREKPKKKPLRAGKCSTGKMLKGNKCVPDPNYKKPAKKGFGEGVLYKSMEPGDKSSALSMRAVKALKKAKLLKEYKKK